MRADDGLTADLRGSEAGAGGSLSPVSAGAEPDGTVGYVIIACSFLTFTLLLIIIIAAAIKCESPGPVLSRKELIRTGGRCRALLKFRTTLEPAEPDWRRGWQLTRMGQFLRYTRMDELPQLLDALLGVVSLAELFDWSPAPHPLEG